MTFRETIDRAFRVLLAITIPVAVVLSIGIRPLIAAAFDFTPEGTELVTWITRIFLFGVIGHSLLEVAVRSFYAQQEARIPLLASGLNLLAYVLLAALLFGPLGAAGIALANTLAFAGEALLLILWLDRRVPGKFRLGSTVLRAVAGSAAAGGIAWLAMNSLAVPAVLLAAAGLGLGALVMLPFVWKEMRLLIRL